jgi:predicted transcriptional regulator
VVADTHVGSLTVKGSSVIGFDPATTVQKTLRKPAEQLKSITSVGKPAARKAFKEIKATEVKWNGRSNEHLLILKVY